MKALLFAVVVSCAGAALAGCQSTSVIKTQGSSFQMHIPKTGIGPGGSEQQIIEEIFVKGRKVERDVSDGAADHRVFSEEVPSLSSQNELTFRKGWYRKTFQGNRLNSFDSYVEFNFEIQCKENAESYVCSAKTMDDAKRVVGRTKEHEVRNLTEGDIINTLVRSYRYDYVTQTASSPSAVAGKIRTNGRNAHTSSQEGAVSFHISGNNGVAEVQLVIQESRPYNRVEVQVDMTLNRSGAGDYDYTPLASKVEKFVQEVTGSI